MEGLGTYLKQGRREAGLSLEDLAGRTRIRIENLERLEREALDDLPNELYVRGFVKLVCQELGLSPQEGLARYESLKVTQNDPRDEIVWTGAREADDASTLERALRDPERVIGTAKWVAGGVGVLVVLLLLVWGGRTVAGWWQNRAQEPTVAAVTPVEATQTDPAPVETTSPAADRTERDAGAPAETAPAEEAPAETAPAETPSETVSSESATPEPIDLALADVAVPLPTAGIQPDPSLAGKLTTATVGAPSASAEDGASEEVAAADPAIDEAPADAPVESTQPTLALTETSPELFRGDPAVRPDESLAELLRPAPTPEPVVVADPEAADDRGDEENAAEEVAIADAVTTPPASETVDPAPSRTAPPRERIEERAAAETPVESDPEPVVATPTPRPTPVEPVVVRSSRSGRARLEIEALRAVDVSVLLDGIGVPRERSLAAGERKRYFADDGFVLSATDAGAVRVWLDGQEVSGLGATGTRLTAREIRRR